MHDLRHYLPPILHDVQDFRVLLDVEQALLRRGWEDWQKVAGQPFVASAEGAGLDAWETELGLAPTDADAEQRRWRIRTALSCEAAYTLRWLIDYLTLACGTDALPTVTLDRYTLTVALPSTVDDRYLTEQLRQYIPANLALHVRLRLRPGRLRLYTGTAIQCTHRLVASAGNAGA